MIKCWSRVLGCILICCIGCGKEPPPMKQDILVSTLVDMHIAEGLTNSHHPIALRDSLLPLYVRQVLETQGITQIQFEEAMAYMHRNPEYMDMIYTDVLQGVADIALRLDEEEDRKRDLEFDDGVDKDENPKTETEKK